MSGDRHKQLRKVKPLIRFLVPMVILSGTGPLNAEPVARVHCLEKGIRGSVIFLHGMTDSKADFTADESVLVMKKISGELGLALAVPVSGMSCSRRSKLCWNMHSEPEKLKDLSEMIREKSAGCFSSRSAPVYWVGFSNGGYLLNKLAQWCLLDRHQRLISIGSAGTFPKDFKSGKNCPHLHLMASGDERVYRDSQRYARNFQERSGMITFMSFRGGHRVPLQELTALLKDLIKPVPLIRD